MRCIGLELRALSDNLVVREDESIDNLARLSFNIMLADLLLVFNA